MTTLKTIFDKPVDRPIEGVIKADDEASLRLEIEEYVLTNEIEKRLESFLDAYNSYEGANGVWISGFFGSGKSHLLKMLALLLENREIDGVRALELFLPKCGNNEILRGDLKRAVEIPSRSILFNIDQKADVISKTQIDALVAVFVKVFDEMCGYYGKQGHIAQFERDLDSRSLYEDFKTAYKAVSGRTWQKGREQALLESKNIAKAYAQVTGGDESLAAGILDKYRNEYRASIEDFAGQVQEYIDRQAPDFRLNFLVDEVGQYISENVKLMTNLQTIAESLATKCRGRAWVIVTAQEDMAAVVGEMGKQQGNDFSKIQARFANRMKLTSQDVDEVIQKRLLTKNDNGIRLLSDVYHAQANNFRTLFDFADGSQTYRNFRDRDHFIHSYPFIPYQFALFQSAIQNLSQHNAFEGKHSSVGERSMLGVFQQVAIKIGDHELGHLATFDLMFEGIRTALKSNIQRAIIQAENHLDDQFAIRLLKTLFLVKYVKEFKATIRNLCVLMLEEFAQDLPALRKRVEEALNLLEQQTYIQRNGNLYEFLTDEEKDIEQEIKNTEAEASDVADELEKLIFDHVVKQKKIRHEDNSQDYPYSRKLDDRLHGREYELTIHVISPFHENVENESILRMQTMGRDELLVMMPADDRLVHDLLMYKRTEKYIRQNVSIAQQEAVKRILNDKGFQNQERYADLKTRIQSLLSKAKLFIAGTEIDTGSTEAQTRIVRGFHELISRVYPNLRMLRGVAYTENDIEKCLKHSEEGLFGTDSVVMSEPEQDVLAFIQSNNRGGVRTTLKGLVEKFQRKPYGWHYAAVLCMLAKLCVRGKVEVRVDGNLLDSEDLERALRNSHGHGNVVLEPQVEFTASQIRALKEFYEDFFDSPPPASEAKALGKETTTALQNLLSELSALATLESQFSFLSVLKPVLETLEEISHKPYIWYLTELSNKEDSLLDMKERLIEPIRKFMSGAQKEIYENAWKFVQSQKPNFAYLEGNEALQLMESLANPECFKGNHMQEVKSLLEALKQKLDTKLDAERTDARQTVSELKNRLCTMPEFSALDGEKQQQLTTSFDEFDNLVENEGLIAFIRDRLRNFEESEYQNKLSELITWTQREEMRDTTYVTDGGSKERETLATATARFESRVEVVSSRSIRVNFDKAWLADEPDVDSYLKLLREALLAEIRKGKRIQL